MNNSSTLHNAIKNGKDLNYIHQLIENDKKILTKFDRKGRLPIHIAVRENKVDLIKCLIPTNDGCVKPAMEDKKGFSPISIALLKGHFDCFEVLMGINDQDIAEIRVGVKNENLLHLAIRKCNAQMLKFILIRYPNQCKKLFKIVDKKGDTPISLAANLGAFSEIRCLLDHGDSIENIQDKKFKSQYNTFKSDPNFDHNYYMYFPETLVFKGGGAKGIIYYGAVEALEEENILPFVKRVAGSSVGAITAAMLAMGCTASEIKENVESTAGGEFMDWDFNWCGKGDFALNSGQKFLEWMDNLIKEKTGIAHCTFGELRKLIEKGKPFKHLHVFATALKEPSKQRFNSEEPEQENIIISEAVRASMAYPGLFAPHSIIKKESKEGEIIFLSESRQTASVDYDYVKKNMVNEKTYSDGGIADNFPIHDFDRPCFISNTSISNHQKIDRIFNNRVLGFSLSKTKDPIKKEKEENVFNCPSSYLWQVYKAKNISDKLRDDFEKNPMGERRIVQIFNCHIWTTNLIWTSPFYGKGQKGIKAGYETTIKFFEDHWNQLSTHFSMKRSISRQHFHEFMLLKSSQQIPIKNSFAEIKSLNNELKLFDDLSSKILDSKTKQSKVEEYFKKYSRFFSNSEVQFYLTQYLAFENNKEYFKHLSNTNILSNLKFYNGISLIHEVLKNQKYNSFEALINVATDLTAQPLLDQYDNTILHAIAVFDDIDAFNILKSKPAKLQSILNAKNKDDETPYLIAVKNDFSKIRQLLIDFGADVSESEMDTKDAESES